MEYGGNAAGRRGEALERMSPQDFGRRRWGDCGHDVSVGSGFLLRKRQGKFPGESHRGEGALISAYVVKRLSMDIESLIPEAGETRDKARVSWN